MSKLEEELRLVVSFGPNEREYFGEYSKVTLSVNGELTINSQFDHLRAIYAPGNWVSVTYESIFIDPDEVTE